MKKILSIIFIQFFLIISLDIPKAFALAPGSMFAVGEYDGKKMDELMAAFEQRLAVTPEEEDKIYVPNFAEEGDVTATPGRRKVSSLFETPKPHVAFSSRKKPSWNSSPNPVSCSSLAKNTPSKIPLRLPSTAESVLSEEAPLISTINPIIHDFLFKLKEIHKSILRIPEVRDKNILASKFGYTENDFLRRTDPSDWERLFLDFKKVSEQVDLLKRCFVERNFRQDMVYKNIRNKSLFDSYYTGFILLYSYLKTKKIKPEMNYFLESYDDEHSVCLDDTFLLDIQRRYENSFSLVTPVGLEAKVINSQKENQTQNNYKTKILISSLTGTLFSVVIGFIIGYAFYVGWFGVFFTFWLSFFMGATIFISLFLMCIGTIFTVWKFQDIKNAFNLKITQMEKNAQEKNEELKAKQKELESKTAALQTSQSAVETKVESKTKELREQQESLESKVQANLEKQRKELLQLLEKKKEEQEVKLNSMLTDINAKLEKYNQESKVREEENSKVLEEKLKILAQNLRERLMSLEKIEGENNREHKEKIESLKKELGTIDDKKTQDISRIAKQVEKLEQSSAERFAKQEEKIKRLEQAFEEHKASLGEIKKALRKMNSHMNTNFEGLVADRNALLEKSTELSSMVTSVQKEISTLKQQIETQGRIRDRLIKVEHELYGVEKQGTIGFIKEVRQGYLKKLEQLMDLNFKLIEVIGALRAEVKIREMLCSELRKDVDSMQFHPSSSLFFPTPLPYTNAVTEVMMQAGSVDLVEFCQGNGVESEVLEMVRGAEIQVRITEVSTVMANAILEDGTKVIFVDRASMEFFKGKALTIFLKNEFYQLQKRALYKASDRAQLERDSFIYALGSCSGEEIEALGKRMGEWLDILGEHGYDVRLLNEFKKMNFLLREVFQTYKNTRFDQIDLSSPQSPYFQLKTKNEFLADVFEETFRTITAA